MKKILLTLLVGMFISTGLSAKALGQGKMKASMSAGFAMVTGENDTTITQIKVGQQAGFAFLTTNAAGLSFSYGLTKDMDIMYTMPVWMKTDVGATLEMPVVGKVDYEKHDSKMLGTPLLGVIYHMDLGNLGLRLAPYLGLPFLEMHGITDKDGKSVDDKNKDGDDISYNFKQPITLGLSMAVDSKMPGAIYWQAWLNLNMGMFGTDAYSLESYDHTSFSANISALVGYKINPASIVKLQLFWVTPDLLNDEKGAKGFADSSLVTKILYGMKLNANSGFNASVDVSMGFTDKAGKTPLKTDATFAGGLTVDYWMTF